MSYVNSLVAFQNGGLSGIQGCQRDWSPYLVHLTRYRAMEWVRGLAVGSSPKDVARLLRESDDESWKAAKAILASRTIQANSPSEKDQIPPCVCLSECNLPGLISHSERFGRFGFVLRKKDVYAAGGRPCLYMGTEEYAEIAKLGRGKPLSDPTGRLFGLANVFAPPGHGKVQDFTHEREWRVFVNVELKPPTLVAVIAPDRFCAEIRTVVEAEVHVVPIDMLFEWGA